MDESFDDGAAINDGIPALAILLGLPEAELREAIGGPWNTPQEGPDLGLDITIVTGRYSPQTPDRPLVAIRIDHGDGVVDIGKAIGVPLPNGRMQYALAEPRTRLHSDLDEPTSVLQMSDLLEGLRAAVTRVADASMLRGTSW